MSFFEEYRPQVKMFGVESEDFFEVFDAEWYLVGLCTEEQKIEKLENLEDFFKRYFGHTIER